MGTAEAIIGSNTVSDRRVPKIIRNYGGRKNIPSFAGNINIGRVNPEEKPATQNRFNQQRPTQRVTSPPTQARRNNQNFQTNFNQRKPQRQFPQRTQQQQPQQQQSFDRGLNPFSPDTEPSQPLSIFKQVKNRINKEKAQEAKPTTRTTEQPSLSPSQQRIRDRILKQRQQQAQDIANILSQESVESTSEQSSFRQSPQQKILPNPSSANAAASFGVFEEVNLAGRFGGPNPPSMRQAPRQLPRQQQQQQDGFFGVFPEVNLQ